MRRPAGLACLPGHARAGRARWGFSSFAALGHGAVAAIRARGLCWGAEGSSPSSCRTSSGTGAAEATRVTGAALDRGVLPLGDSLPGPHDDGPRFRLHSIWNTQDRASPVVRAVTTPAREPGARVRSGGGGSLVAGACAAARAPRKAARRDRRHPKPVASGPPLPPSGPRRRSNLEPAGWSSALGDGARRRRDLEPAKRLPLCRLRPHPSQENKINIRSNDLQIDPRSPHRRNTASGRSLTDASTRLGADPPSACRAARSERPNQAPRRSPRRLRSVASAAGPFAPSFANSWSCAASSRLHNAESTLITCVKRSCGKSRPVQFRSP